ncbi:MAG TPA: carboxypeptidase-like regulatory domain-containing protein [Bryobacteraceae bacterium]|nr:carboxypeptidase-like regulatory domain-containing protein [Bryobacteraceae bacterium]
MRFLSIPVVVCSVALFLAGTAGAQVTGSISGAITDSTGAGVPNATVTITELDTRHSRSVITDDRGTYRVLALPVGRYEVKAEHAGFKTALRTGISLVVAQEAVVDESLQVGEATQQIEVSAEAPVVDVTTTTISGLVGERQVKDLPLNGRSFDNLITLNPGTANTTSNRSPTSTGGGQGNNFSVSGNREDYNIFLLNGIEYTGVSTADVIPGGVSGQLLGVDAVREFNVLENTYGAEYGKRPGGQISLVTMSGTNQFHGSLFEFIRNSDLDARNYFDQSSVPPLRRNQFGASAGGPIRKDKTFVFGSYEGLRWGLSQSAAAIVPDQNARLGILGGSNIGLAPGIAPYFNLWPVPNGPEIGGGAAFAYANPLQTVREDFGNLRVDHNFSSSDTLSGVYTVDDGISQTPGANPLQQTLSVLRSQVASVQETHVFSPSVLNTFRAGFSRAAWHLDGSSSIHDSNLVFVQGKPVGSISIGASGLGNLGSFVGAGTNGAQQVETIHRNLFTYADDVGIVRGKHQIKAGVWFQRVQSNDDAADQRNGIASFADLQHFMQGQATQVVATLSPTEIGWRQFAGAWYVQDAMSLRPNLTLTLGLRHEFNNGWNSPADLASNFVTGPGGILQTQPVVGTSIYNENNAKLLFGPRAGLAWSPFGGSKIVIHAGFGIYYEQLDYIGSCCDAAPLGTSNQKVVVSPAAFPILLAPGEPIPGAKISPAGIQPNLKMPTVQQYSFHIDQALSNNTVLSVGYVGEHGIHLLDTVDQNTAIPTILANGSKFFPAKSPRANPNLGNARYELSNANSNYNGLQVDLRQRLSHGIQFRVNYTFQKSLDIHSASFLANAGVGGTTTILDPTNPRLDWGRSNFDIQDRLSGNFSYELPFGKGRSLLANGGRVQNAIVGGWQLNGILSAQTGFPFTPLVGFNQSGNGDSRAPDRPDLTPGFSGPIVVGTQKEWFNPAAFQLPAAGTYGNAGRDIIEGPGLLSFDSSLFKSFRIRERADLQFRTEFFNVLNHTNFGLPLTTTFTSSGKVSPSGGLITYTSTTSRQLQFGLKLTW